MVGLRHLVGDVGRGASCAGTAVDENAIACPGIDELAHRLRLADAVTFLGVVLAEIGVRQDALRPGSGIIDRQRSVGADGDATRSAAPASANPILRNEMLFAFARTRNPKPGSSSSRNQSTTRLSAP